MAPIYTRDTLKTEKLPWIDIDDYEFILSFEAESPEKFQDLMMELRESEASA